MTENKYKDGKIYKLTSEHTILIYIGSTINLLSDRKSGHIGSYNLNRSCMSKKLIELGKIKIELIENYPCNNKDELVKRELFYIDMYKDICINKVRKLGMNKEERIEYNKNYFINNKEKIKEIRAKKINCEKCNKLLCVSFIKRHKCCQTE
jgi:hypothetical protein